MEGEGQMERSMDIDEKENRLIGGKRGTPELLVTVRIKVNHFTTVFKKPGMP